MSRSKGTELSRQLDALATRERGASLKIVGLKSFLFDTREAQSYDSEAIHAIGSNGLLELAASDSRFAEFRESLFSLEARAVAPEQRTQQELDETDSKIEHLCDLLCSHFSRRAAHKVIEWLIRGHKAFSRPRAVDALLTAAIPYHDTAAFARLLPVLRLAGKWEFLRSLARSGMPMPRSAFVAQCRADTSMLAWVVGAARRAHERDALSRPFSCFAGAVCVEVLDPAFGAGVSNKAVTALLPLIVDGLRASGPSALRSLAYLAASQLASAAQLTKNTLSNILGLAIRGCAGLSDGSDPVRGCTLMVVHLCRSQRQYGRIILPRTVLGVALSTAGRWIKELSVVSGAPLSYDVSSFCDALSRLLLKNGIVAAAPGEGDEAAEVRRKKSWKALASLVREVELPKDMAVTMCKRLLRLFAAGHDHSKEDGQPEKKKKRKQKESAEEDEEREEEEGEEEGCKECKRLKKLLSLLSAKYPDQLDKAVDLCLASLPDSGHWLFEVLSAAFSGTVHQPMTTGGVLSIAVRHPEASVRIEALRKLGGLVEDGPSDELLGFARAVAAERLADDDEPVVLEVLGMRWAIDLVPPAELLPRVLAVLGREPSPGIAAIRACLDVLVRSVAEKDPALKPQIASALWPHLLVSGRAGGDDEDADRAFVQAAHKLGFALFSGIPEPAAGPVSRLPIARAIAVALASGADELLPVVTRLPSDSPRGRILSLAVLLAALGASAEKPAAALPIAGALFPLLLADLSGGSPASAEKAAAAALTTMDEVVRAVLTEEGRCQRGGIGVALATAALCCAVQSTPLGRLTPNDFSAPAEAECWSRIALLNSVFCGSARIEVDRAQELTKRVLAKLSGSTAVALFLTHAWTRRGSGVHAQIRAINLASITLCSLASCGADATAEVAVLLPALVVAVQSEQRFVRNAAICCLGFVAAARVDPTAGGPPCVSFARALVAAKVELLAEPSFLVGVCAQLAAAAPSDAARIAERLAVAAVAAGSERGARTRNSLLVPAAALSPVDTLRATLPTLAGLVRKRILDAGDAETAERLLSLHGPATAEQLLNSTSGAFEPFLECLTQNPAESEAAIAAGEAHGLCLAALKHVTPELWAALDGDRRQLLLERLVGLSGFGGTEHRAAARATVAALPLTAEQLEPFLAVTARRHPLAIALARANVALEALEDRNSDWTLCRALLPSVFGVVRALIDPQEEASRAPSREFTLQVALGALARVTAAIVSSRRETIAAADPKLVATASEEMDEEKPKTPARGPPKVMSAKSAKKKEKKDTHGDAELERLYDIELVTRCMKAVGSPQVHIQALSFLASAAALLPDLILRHVVDIVSFIATSAMTQDDTATFDILSKTIEGIVPPMIRGSAGSPGGAAPVLQALVGGFTTIPRHRRLVLFKTVVETISVDRLGLVLIALLAKQLQQQAASAESNAPQGKGESSSSGGEDDEEEDDEEGDISAFCRKLCLAFSPAVAVKALDEVVRFAFAAATGSGLGDWAAYVAAGNGGAAAAGARLAVSALRFAETHVGSREFVYALLETGHEAERAEADPHLMTLFEDAVRVVRDVHVSRSGGSSGAEGVTDAARGVLSSVKNALAVPAFLGAIARLLRSPSEPARRTALVLLNEKLDDLGTTMTEEEAGLLTDLGPSGVLGLVVSMLGARESAVSRQTALLTLEILARAMARAHPDNFEPLLGRAVGSLGDQDENVASSALLCVATFVSEIGPLAIPHLPQFMPVVLGRLEAALSAAAAADDTDERLMPTLSALMVIVQHIARFLSPYASRLVALLLHPALVGGSGRAAASAARVLGSLTESVEPRLLLDPVFAVYTDHTATSAASLVRLFDVVRDVTARMQPAAVAANHKRMLKFFIDGAFGFREHYGELLPGSEPDADTIESRIIAAFVQLVLKLNENAFKPVFLKVGDHFQHLSSRSGSDAVAEFGDRERESALFFCRIIKALTEALRGIFAPFYGFVTDYLLGHLRARDSAELVARMLEDGEGKARGKKRQRAEEELERVQEAEAKLATVILDSLSLCFAYDTQGFVDSAFGQLVSIADQLDNFAVGPERYSRLVEGSLVPCLSQLAVAASKDGDGSGGNSKQDKWKTLNHQMLLRTRNENAEVRRHALRAIADLWRKAGEDIVAVLPETVPYLSEALQDSDPQVETAANELAEVMQSYLGEESLRDYL